MAPSLWGEFPALCSVQILMEASEKESERISPPQVLERLVEVAAVSAVLQVDSVAVCFDI